MSKGISAKGKIVPIDSLIGVFVSASRKDSTCFFQGWVVEADPFRVKGRNGVIYECEGMPVASLNPPKMKMEDVANEEDPKD